MLLAGAVRAATGRGGAKLTFRVPGALCPKGKPFGRIARSRFSAMFRRSKPPARKSAPKSDPQPPQPRPGPIVVGYMRISTDEQVLDLQRQALLKAGATVLYQDEGIPGATMARPGLQAALADLQSGDTFAVWKLDRLGRRAADLLAFLTALEKRGVR